VGCGRNAVSDCVEQRACSIAPSVSSEALFSGAPGSSPASLQHSHAERIDIVYRRGDQYISGALAKLDFFLRAHRTGDVRPLRSAPVRYSVRSQHFQSDIPTARSTSCAATAPRRRMNPFALTPPEWPGTAFTFKRKQSTCACPASIRSSCARRHSRCVAGAVGYYPHSDFIHVDTGRVRQWCFDCPASLTTGD